MSILALTLAVASLCGPQAGDGTFASFDRRAQAGETLNVVYFGGSLTWSANASDPSRTGFRGLMSDYLASRYPKARLRFHDAAIGGSGSLLGMFRLERDVLSRSPDLVFLDFLCNDGGDTCDPEASCAYEHILRELIGRGVPVEQLFFTFRFWLEPKGDYEKTVKRLPLYRRLAEAYGTPFADVAPFIRGKIRAGEATFDSVWPLDGGHPCDLGYGYFFEAARLAFERAVKEGAACRVPAEPVWGDASDVRRLVLPKLGTLPAGWTRAMTFRTSMWFDGMSSRWMDGVVSGKTGAEPLALEATGNLFAFFGEADGKTAVPFELSVDGAKVAKIPFSHGCDGRLFVFRSWKTPDWTEGRGGLRRIGISPLAGDPKRPKANEVRLESLMSATLKPTAAALEAAAVRKSGKGVSVDKLDHARGAK